MSSEVIQFIRSQVKCKNNFPDLSFKKKMFYSMLKAKKERYLQNLLEEEKGDGVYPDVLVRGQQ